MINSAIAPGFAAGATEERKRIRYQGTTDRYLIEPVAIATTGVLGSGTRKFFHHLGRLITTLSGDRRETAWLYERLSIAIARGNSASILTTGCVNA